MKVSKLSLTVNMKGLHCVSLVDVEEVDLPCVHETTSTVLSRCRCAVMDWGGGSATSSSSMSNITVFETVFFFFEAVGLGRDDSVSFSDCLCLGGRPHLVFFGDVLIGLTTGVGTGESKGGMYASSMKVICLISLLTMGCKHRAFHQPYYY